MFFNCQRRKKLKDKNKQRPGKQNADLVSCKMDQGSLPLREREINYKKYGTYQSL